MTKITVSSSLELVRLLLYNITAYSVTLYIDDDITAYTLLDMTLEDPGSDCHQR